MLAMRKVRKCEGAKVGRSAIAPCGLGWWNKHTAIKAKPAHGTMRGFCIEWWAARESNL